MQAWRIYCGQRDRDGRLIDARAIRRFLRHVVGTKFASFTILRTAGVWQHTSEPSIVIEILASGATAARQVAEVASEYKRRFRQQAVLIVRSTVQSTRM